jgi:hypothetical protein
VVGLWALHLCLVGSLRRVSGSLFVGIVKGYLCRVSGSLFVGIVKGYLCGVERWLL